MEVWWLECPECKERTLYWDRTQEMYACHHGYFRWTSRTYRPPAPTPGGSVRSDARKRREARG